MPIKIDPETGLKIFNTRAAKANDKITGKGYSVVDDEALKALPDAPAEAVFDADEKAKYQAFKDSRTGVADYIALEGEFAKYMTDVHSVAPVERDALDDECEILIVGAGFAGLLLWYKLSKAGFKDVRICEKGGDVGGTWYWNRYPGIACDVEAYSYLPLLEETGFIPSMKFASGFEIQEHCQNIATKFGFYDKCLFHTTVEDTQWDESIGRWQVSTDRGDKMKAKYLVVANGILTTPKLSKIKGMENFKGDAFHTSRWDYNVDLTDKRVGIIGTGATAVQIIPEIAKTVKQLCVFQRTPSSIDVRDQRETTAEEKETWKTEEDWAKKRRARFAKISSGRTALEANDDYLSGKIEHFKEKKKHAKKLSPEEMQQKQLDTNFRIMEQIRARVDNIVDDPKTAASLKPYYNYGCKRPTFHDEYLPTFNQSHVTLIDTAPRGVAEINENGIIHEGVEYPLDVLIYATGFQWMATQTFSMIKGREGLTLKDKWAQDGTKTFLGLQTKGFPNMFIISGPQGGGGSFNFTDTIEDHGDYVLWMLETMREQGADVVDINEESQVEYAKHCAQVDTATQPLRDCISYYDHEGKAEPGALVYYGGRMWHQYRTKGQETLAPYAFESKD
ncbi:MAG: NAD(P)/FAD-dependent oxidoreductase [Porticoccaceae bacterium]|nr:NAD(P)/FAD-dependent oxidoreductase [Porticoccaceae bacterium]